VVNIGKFVTFSTLSANYFSASSADSRASRNTGLADEAQLDSGDGPRAVIRASAKGWAFKSRPLSASKWLGNSRGPRIG
jgi:hypothetical protein